MNPTVGRIVHFNLSLDTAKPHEGTQPRAAIVAKVWNPGLVNLTVINEDGTTRAETSVPFQQADTGTPRSAFWPPKA